MPNRIIRESILTSPTVDAMSAAEERFFLRLMLLVDDFGRFDARASVIRGRAFPLKRDVSDDDILAWLRRLVELEVVTVYEVRGKRFVWFLNWDAYQSRRAKESKWPAPEEGVAVPADQVAPLGMHLQADASRREQMRAPSSSRAQPQANVPVVVVGVGDEVGDEVVPSPRPAVVGGDAPPPPVPAADQPTAADAPPPVQQTLPATATATRAPRKPKGAEADDGPNCAEDRQRWLDRYCELKRPPFPPALTKADCIFFAQQRKARGMDELLWVLETLHEDAYSAHSTVRQLLSPEAAQKAAGLRSRVAPKSLTANPYEANLESARALYRQGQSGGEWIPPEDGR
jgi:hypothetical protein